MVIDLATKDVEIRKLATIIRTFIRRANRVCGVDSEWYEPTPGQGYLWSNLTQVVENAESMLVDLDINSG